MNVFLTIVVLGMWVVTTINAAESVPATTAATNRMDWWREAKFGMFVHWGLYAVPAGAYDGRKVGGIGEWIMKNGRIPVARYGAYAKEFNPVKFNADEWVALAKQAGMNYIIITAKHHDGFAMFPSKVSPFNIHEATPFKRDPLAELAAACRQQGIRLGFYYSQAQDWHHPGGAGAGWDPAQKGDMLQYVKTVAVPQVTELLTNYGPDVPAVLWWDTPEGITREMADHLFGPTRSRPNMIQNNRLGGGYQGDTETPEQIIPADGFPVRDWETCMTMNDTWGYKSDDHNWKPTKVLIHNLIDIVSKGGNYLLNVGPTAEGVIPQASVERLQQVGRWLHTNREAIHGTRPNPFPTAMSWGRVTRRAGRLYLHVLDWPKDRQLFVPVTRTVQRARLLAAPNQPVTVTLGTNAQGQVGIVVSLPAQAPDPIASVVALELVASRQAADGSITLSADHADPDAGLLLETIGNGQPNIGNWTKAGLKVDWSVLVNRPGVFDVILQYACAADAGGEFKIQAGSATLHGTVTPTKTWSDFTEATVGQLVLEEAGPLNIQMRAVGQPKIGLINLRAVVLRPRSATPSIKDKPWTPY